MEKFSELIKIRRSMRKFTDEELTQDEVVALLRSALMAPSSKGCHPWEFVVVDDKELLKQLAHCKEQGAELIEGAPLAVAVLADPAKSDVWVEDASVATTMMLLQAEDLGLGACWVQIRNRAMADGKPAEEKSGRRKEDIENKDHLPVVGEIVHVNKRKYYKKSNGISSTTNTTKNKPTTKTVIFTTVLNNVSL